MGLLDALARILTALGIRTDVATFLAWYGLAFARVTSAIALAPFLGGGAVPARVKAGLGAVITAILFMHVTPPESSRAISPLFFAALLVKEAMIGLTIGILAQFVFYAVQMAGSLIDTQRGMSQMTFFAPQLPGNVSSLGQLKFQAALVLFVTIDGHLLFIRALGDSFRPLPLMEFPKFQAGFVASAEQAARLSADALLIAMQLAAPALLALFLVDVAAGAVGKVASQINVHNESQPVKSLAGLAVLLLAIALIMTQLRGRLEQMLLQIQNFLRGMA
ncbi:MAG: flagellar biosynthetic protein FliR [Bryobacteraceae bacterium]